MRFFFEVLQRSFVVPIAPKTSLRGSCSSVCGVTRPSGRHVKIRYATAPRSMAHPIKPTSCSTGLVKQDLLSNSVLSQARGSRCFAATNTTVTCSLCFPSITCVFCPWSYSRRRRSLRPKPQSPHKSVGQYRVPFRFIIQAHDFGGDQGGERLTAEAERIRKGPPGTILRA